MEGFVANKISKQFPGTKALNGVDFNMIPGEVHALIGENGAGKSTLIKILSGLLRPTSGRIQLDGKTVHFDNPHQAQVAGISVITQEFNLVPQLTVAENIFLGREPKRRSGLIDWNTINSRSTKLLQEVGLEVSPTQLLEYLNVADRQLVEIAKALSREFRYIIMDEPTATLNAVEVERLFAIIRRLRQSGTGILYVSHRLNEIFCIADRVTVLRDGVKVGTRLIKKMTEDDAITMMMGRELKESSIGNEQEKRDKTREPALSVRNLTVSRALSGISFDLHYGEVLGCAGLVGSGRSVLLYVIFGLLHKSGGEILVDGRPVSLMNVADAIREGIFMLPEDRKVEGIFPDLNVLENLIINAHRADNVFIRFLIDKKAEKEKYNRVQDSLAIRAYSTSQIISTLSGGNQQKVLLGRAFVTQFRILLLNEPTRGVDVGTKIEIHELIRKMAREGHAILVSSSDVLELTKVSDRCLILKAGRVGGLLVNKQITEDNILAYSVT